MTPPCPERRIRTPLPQQSSSSTREEESQRSAQERAAIARMEQYVNNSDDEVEECSLGPEYADIDVKQISRTATREGRNIFLTLQGERKRRAAGRKQVAMGGLSKTKEIASGNSLERKSRKLKWKIRESGVRPTKTRRRKC